MFNTIEEYLETLKKELKGSDKALVQDALADTFEHLSLAMEEVYKKSPNIGNSDALDSIISEYGLPCEIANAYKDIKKNKSIFMKNVKKPINFWEKAISAYIDPHTWGSLIFMFITFITGILYFTWVIVGAVLSSVLMIVIIGIPLTIGFIVSVQLLAFFEGRLIEVLLGERMPKRPLFIKSGLKWGARLKILITDKHTWFFMIYMLLQMPLGILYFTMNIVLLVCSVTFIFAPLSNVFSIDFIKINSMPHWMLYLLPIAGIIMLTLTMNLIRAIGWIHGKYAKLVLVR
jgi:uncharacterized membrane protein